MNLADTQQALQRTLLQPDDAGGEAAIVAEILIAPPISARQRLRIYTDAYVLRLIEALRANFPKLHRVLGDQEFAALGRNFARARPSNTASIRWFGRYLPSYLACTPPFDAQPILAELAQFEWLLSEVFDAADAAAVSRAELISLQPERWATLQLRFHPSMRCIELNWNTVAVWQAADAQERAADAAQPAPSAENHVPDPRRADRATSWALWRHELQNFFRSLDPKEALALDLAAQGTCFAEICSQLAGLMPEDEVPLYAATLLASWANGGMIAALC